MKVLLVCLRFPYPPADGGTIAMYNMAMALSKAGAQVKIAALNTRKHFTNPAVVPGWFMDEFKPEAVYLDATVTPTGALLNLFSSQSFNISRFDIKEFHFLLEEILKKDVYDVVQLESLFVAPYIETIRKFSQAKIILRAHNVEYIIWERLSVSEKNPLKKSYLSFLASRLKTYESKIPGQVEGLITLTRDDKALFQSMGSNTPVLVSPIGVDTEIYPFKATNESLTAFHLGSMDWQPNIEGIDWFLEQIFPLLVKKFPDLKLHLAGKSMPQRIFDLKSKNLEVSGRIDEAKKFMEDKSIMIVPLLSGGGMRVKIIEGLAMGKTIISTTIGAEGINYTNGLNILIADSAESFIEAFDKCLNLPGFCNVIGTNARKLAVEQYENKVLGFETIEFYRKLPSVKP